MSGKVIRQVSLILLMVTALLFCVILWLAWREMPIMIVPAVGFTGAYVWFIAMEIWGALTPPRKTLSTRFKYWITDHPVYGYIALGLFWIAMTALVVHLGVFW